MGKRLRSVLIPFVLFSGVPLLGQPVTRMGAAGPHPFIQQMVDSVSIDSLKNGVRGLVSLGSRYEFEPGQEAAADWMINRLSRWDIDAESDPFTFPASPFYDISMVTPDWAWVVGKNSVVMRTSDGGRNWVVLNQGAPSGVDLRGVNFLDIAQGWAVGTGGVIMTTADGGTSWIEVASGTTSNLNAVRFADYPLGIAVGSSGTIVRTTDAGITWTTALPIVKFPLTDVTVSDPQNVWVSGDGGTILHSTDGGASWRLQTTGVSGMLYSVCFVNKDLGWSVGSNIILKTIDGGATWSSQPVPPGPPRSLEFQDVCFADSVNGWIVDLDGSVFRTIDGGEHWSKIDALGRYGWAPLGRIGQYAGKYLIACGQVGDITTSTNAGRTWTRQSLNLPTALLHTSRNIRITFPGLVTPEQEIVMLAHYDAVKNSPGADDNASGTSAVLEAARVMASYQFESTVTILLVSAEEGFGAGSGEYAIQAKKENRTIVGAVNADMVAYPVTTDTTRLVVASFLSRNRLIDSAIVYNQRYGIGANLIASIDSLGNSDFAVFGLVGYDNLDVCDATWPELSAGLNPYYHTASDTYDKIHPDLMRRAAKLMVATVAEIAKPYVGAPLTWTWQKPFPQWNHLRSVYALDANTIVSVGDIGTIVKTTDGGRTWAQLVGETIVNLRGVWFTSPSNGYVVGDKGLILRTTNGGSLWTSQTINPNVSFYAVCFSDPNTGTAVGYPSAIYRTTNGGTTWVSQLSGPAATLQGVCFTDANNGTIVGSSGTILHTTNGGVKWSRQLSGFEETDTLFSGVSFSSAAIGTMVGRSGMILHTTNGGTSWTVQPSGTSYHLNAVSFTDANTGTAVGDAGLILRTTDGGVTWYESSSGVTEWFTGVSFTSASTGTAVGSYGTIFRTTDGGASWTLQTQGPRTSLNSVWFTSATTGTVVGYKGAIFRTTDGGATWVTQNSGVKQDLTGICFLDQNTAVAVGEGGIIRTTNAGQTWSVRKSGGFTGVSFASTSMGLAVGRGALIMMTTDGGISWLRMGFNPEKPVDEDLFGVSFGDRLVATVVGDTGRILRSVDGGMTWASPDEQLTKFTFNGVFSIGANLAIVVGDYGMIYRTSDGGATWQQRYSGTNRRLNGVWFVNSSYGLAVGDSGTIVRTTDRGLTWSAGFSGTTSNLASVQFSDNQTGTIVGEKGTILRTILPESPVTAIQEPTVSLPRSFGLAQNYPNPFNPTTTISYQLPAVSVVTLKVYDMLGREIATLVDGKQLAGVHTVRWDASLFPSGVYFYRLATDDFVETKKMVMLK